MKLLIWLAVLTFNCVPIVRGIPQWPKRVETNKYASIGLKPEDVVPLEQVFVLQIKPCYITEQGIGVAVSTKLECPEQIHVEALIDAVYNDAHIKKSRETALKGLLLVYVPVYMDAGNLLAQGVTFGDFNIVVTQRSDAAAWERITKHELLHAVKWKYNRDADINHQDLRFVKYAQGD